METALPESFLKAEVRSDYYVDEKKKKIWAEELNILREFDRVCKKHGLRYMAEYGTLLGAVRHKGFIPWDDDMDFVMFRDEYEKLLEIADTEFTAPFSLTTAYNGPILHPFAKLKDASTTAIENNLFHASPEFNQGVFIDIFPLDDVPDGQPIKDVIFKIQLELWYIVYGPNEVRTLLNKGTNFTLEIDMIEELLKLDDKSRLKEYEKLCASNWGKSERINYLGDELFSISKSRKKEWYEDIVYLDFENMQIPCPAGYDEILKSQYGDYMIPIVGHGGHDNVFFDPDKPYTEYLTNDVDL